MRKCFLDDLPKKEGIGKNKGKMIIDWSNSIGYNIKFIYEDIDGYMYISDFDNHNRMLTVIYNDKEFKIANNQLFYGKIGKIVGKRTKEFKITEDVVKDNIRNLTILERKYINKNKIYKYHCNKCGNEDYIHETDLIKGNNCSVCSHRKTVLGINTIWDTEPWMIDLGVSEKDAKKYMPQSSIKIIVTCPNCGKQKEIVINKIYNRKTISCTCGDGISYSEKFIISMLDQLNIKYEREYKPEWSNNKRYDFYLSDYNMIIECHGGQHYKEQKRGRTLEEEQQNDEYKKELALKNGIDNYIILDCRESNIEWIKNSILDSELNNLFNLSNSNINWLQCEEFALSNQIKQVCDYWYLHNDTNNENLNSSDIGEVFNLSKNTINRYLKKGTKLGWCNYNPKEEIIKSIKKSKGSRKSISIFKNGELKGTFESIIDLERKSIDIFGIKLNYNGISRVLKGKANSYKGFTFKYIE